MVIPYKLICAWVLLLSTTFLRLIPVVACIGSPFLSLRNSRLHNCQFMHSPIGGHLGCFQLLAGKNKATVRILSSTFCGHICLSFLLNEYLRMQLQDYRVDVYLTFKISRGFSVVLVSFCIPSILVVVCVCLFNIFATFGIGSLIILTSLASM